VVDPADGMHKGSFIGRQTRGLHADRAALQPRSARRHAAIELAQKVSAPQLYARCRPGFSTRKRMKIEFFKPERRRYRSVLHRRDGLVIELDGGGYNKVGGEARELPHDLAHFVVEDGLGLEAGLWGVLAAGGLFGHAKVIAGRRPPHATKRAQAVVDAAGDRLSQAEMLTRFVCDLALHGADRDVRRLKTAAGERWWR
jgi:hypothetical protein